MAQLRQGLGLVILGVAVGLAGAFAVTRLLRNLLYDVRPLDPLTFVSVVVGLAAVALLPAGCPRAAPRQSSRWRRCAVNDE